MDILNRKLDKGKCTLDSTSYNGRSIGRRVERSIVISGRKLPGSGYHSE